MAEPQFLGTFHKLLPRLNVLVALIISVVILSSCCGWDDDGSDVTGHVLSSVTMGLSERSIPRINSDVNQAKPNQTVNHILTTGVSGSLPDDSSTILLPSNPVTMTWTPPTGSANFVFNINPEPGGPPFVWQSRPPTDIIHTQFDMPTLPAGESEMTVVETLQSECNGRFEGAVFPTQLSTSGLSPLLTDLASPLTPEDFVVPEGTTIWSIGRFVDPKGITLTTSLCQDYLNFLQSDAAFIAMRLPVSPTTFITESYPIPIAFGGIYSNTLKLGSYLETSPAVTVPLELRPERFTFLANSLPQEAGEMWFALGAVPDPVACPDGVYAPPNNWGMLFSTHLDLSFLPDSCAGCIFPIYRCYEGQAPPGFEMALQDIVDRDAPSYQGEGITCLGPQSFRLRTYPSSWSLSGAHSTWITPTQVIKFLHYINTSTPVTVTLDYSSSLDVDWGIYNGTSTAPNLSDPITGPIKASGSKYFWLISEQVPTSVPSGPYNLIVTATSTSDLSDTRWRGDLIWVGEWVTPPGWIKRWLYLPQVNKSP